MGGRSRLQVMLNREEVETVERLRKLFDVSQSMIIGALMEIGVEQGQARLAEVLTHRYGSYRIRRSAFKCLQQKAKRITANGSQSATRSMKQPSKLAKSKRPKG